MLSSVGIYMYNRRSCLCYIQYNRAIARRVGKWEGQQVGGGIFHTSIQEDANPFESFEMQHLGLGYQA